MYRNSNTDVVLKFHHQVATSLLARCSLCITHSLPTSFNTPARPGLAYSRDESDIMFTPELSKLPL